MDYPNFLVNQIWLSNFISIFRQGNPNDDIFDQATQATDMDGNNDSDASEDLLGEDEDDLIMDEHVQEDPGERSNNGQKSPTRINESDEDMFEGNISNRNTCILVQILIDIVQTWYTSKYSLLV